MTKIRFQLALKPTKAEKAAQGKTGFVPIATRWIIERSNAWMERCKSLVKNFERTLDHATAKIDLCFIRVDAEALSQGIRSQMGSIINVFEPLFAPYRQACSGLAGALRRH